MERRHYRELIDAMLTLDEDDRDCCARLLVIGLAKTQLNFNRAAFFDALKLEEEQFNART